MKRLAVALLMLASIGVGAQVPTRVPTAGVTPILPGQVQIVATYVNANGKVVSDTTRINVLPVAVSLIELFNTFNPPGWTTDVQIGKPFCAYAQAKDSVGNILTGRPVTFTSTNPQVAAITPSALCPDTTIDASKIPANALPPLQLGYRFRR